MSARGVCTIALDSAYNDTSRKELRVKFAAPEAFLLLLLWPVYLVLLWRGRAQSSALPLATYSFLSPVRRREWRIWLPGALYLLGFVLVVGALARPQSSREVVKQTQQGVDIMLAVDTSGSMLAEDFTPNRLEVAKQVLQDFVTEQQGNRLGIVVFAGRSFTLLPLTTDQNLVAESLGDITADMVAVDGTAIGDAIANALYRFNKDNTKSRVLILLTDGENNAGNIQPLVAAQFARQRNVKIYTIGMGKPGGAPIPFFDRQTGQRMYVRDRYGNFFLTRINESDLKAIAAQTGGLYFKADNQQKLAEIYQRIAQMEKSEFEVRRSTRYSELMMWLLVPALLCWMAGYSLEATLCRRIRV